MKKVNLLLDMVGSIKKNRNIPEESIIAALEESITSVVNSKYSDVDVDGFESNVFAKFNIASGDVAYYRSFVIEDIPANSGFKISHSDAAAYKPDFKNGDVISKFFPDVLLTNIDIKNATRIFNQQILKIEREIEYNSLLPLMEKSTLLEVKVKKVGPSSSILSLLFPLLSIKSGNQRDIELVLQHRQKMQHDNFKVGDVIHCVLSNVVRDDLKIQGHCSRVSPKLLEALMKKYIPEIAHESISIIAVARDPGSKSKIAVMANDPRIDGVGACIGVGGSKIQSIIKEIGERIDVINYDNNIVKFAVNALAAPRAIVASELNEDGGVTIVVHDDVLGSVIGRAGQNVRLASQLIGVDITVVGNSEAKEKNQRQNMIAIDALKQDLDVDEGIASLLLSLGYSNVEKIANTSVDDLLKIEGFDEEVCVEIKDRAIAAATNKILKLKKEAEGLEIDSGLAELIQDHAQRVELSKNGIKTIYDLAELSAYDLVELSSVFNLNVAKELIMKARELVY